MTSLATRLWHTATCLCLAYHSMFGRAQGADVNALFLREYPSAAARLEDVYRTIQMRVMAKETREEGLLPHLIRQEQYARRDGLFRFTNDFVASDRAGRSPGDRTVLVANPKFSFALVRAADQDTYQVTEVEAYTATMDATSLAYKPLRAPFSYFEHRIVDFIGLPGFVLTNVGYEDREGTELVKVDWEYNYPGTKQRGYFLFDASQSWALREYKNYRWSDKAAGPSGSFVQGVIQYKGSFEGVPLIHTFRQWVEFHGVKSDKVVIGKPVQIEEYEVLEIKTDPLPEEEFQLSAFGLPNPGQITTARRTWYLVLSNVMALALLGLAWWIRRRGQRRSKSSGDQPAEPVEG